MRGVGTTAGSGAQRWVGGCDCCETALRLVSLYQLVKARQYWWTMVVETHGARERPLPFVRGQSVRSLRARAEAFLRPALSHFLMIVHV